MKVQLAPLLTFDALFNDKIFQVEDEARKLPLTTAIEYICWSTAQLSLNEFDLEKQDKILNMWIADLPQSHISVMRKIPQKIFAFISKSVSLQVIQLILEYGNIDDSSNELTRDQMLTLIKVYTYKSMTFTNKQNDIANQISKLNFSTLESHIEAFLPIKLPYFDLSIISSLPIEIYKAAEFFKYCENIPEQNSYLIKYLDSMGFKNWQEYLSKLLMIYYHLYKEIAQDKIKSSIELDDNHEQTLAIKKLLELLSVRMIDFKSHEDFLYIRERPVLQLKENSFTLLSNDLFLNKFFQVIQFDYGNFIKNNGGVAHERKVKSFLDYKSVYSLFFSEETLLYNILSSITNKKKYKAINGTEAKKALGPNKTEPDYYIRENKNIYLFEAKDAIFSTLSKLSYNYEAIINEVKKKLIELKGMKQLVSTIQSIVHRDFSEVDDKIPSTFNIYPILIITDASFSAFGINYILDKELKRLLGSVPKHAKIHPLSLIRIDTLIEFREAFSQEKVTLKKAVSGYTQKLADKGHMLNPIESFDEFMQKKYGKHAKPTWQGIEQDIHKIIEHT